ncbi:hypothetical protein [uncultured Clostridium sp.]|uniref:hypothetical protein n=1 Tax=uncultured Clostridium sp. TaxID=59620 RepID=UPI002622E133|nr:hypothetical protein [uncultured Clostridium sp.]
MSLLFLIEFFIIGIIIFLSYNLSNKRKHPISVIFIILFAIFTIFSLLLKGSWDSFLSVGDTSSMYNSFFARFPNHLTQIPIIIFSILLFSVLGLLWGIFLFIISKSSSEKKFNLENTHVTPLINSYINKETITMEDPLSGADFAHKVNSLYSLFKLELMDTKELELKKFQLISSLYSENIPCLPEEFIIDFKKTLKSDYISNEELKNIFEILSLKDKLKKNSDKELILLLSTDNDIKELFCNALKFELHSRGYSDVTLAEIISLRNMDNLELFKSFYNSKLEYLGFKLTSRNIDYELLLKVIPVLHLSLEEALNKYLENDVLLTLSYKKALSSTKIKKIRRKKLVTPKFIIPILILIMILCFVIAKTFFSTPSNTDAINYVKKVESNATNIHVLSSNYLPPGDSNYAIELSYNFKSDNNDYSNTGIIYYTHNYFKWTPTSFTKGTANEIPKSGLTLTQMKDLLNDTVIQGLQINSENMELTNIKTDLKTSSITANFTYTDPNIRALKNIVGQVYFTFSNGSWKYSNAVTYNVYLNAPPISSEELISMFKTSPNSPLPSEEHPGVNITVSVQNVSTNATEGSCNATFVVTVKNGIKTTINYYNALFQYLIDNSGNPAPNFTTPNWYLVSCSTDYSKGSTSYS